MYPPTGRRRPGRWLEVVGARWSKLDARGFGPLAPGVVARRNLPPDFTLVPRVRLKRPRDLEVARQRVRAEHLEVVADRNPDLALVAEAPALDPVAVDVDELRQADPVRVVEIAGVRDVLMRRPAAEQRAAVRQPGLNRDLEPVVDVTHQVRSPVDAVGQALGRRVAVERQEGRADHRREHADRVVERDAERHPRPARHAGLRGLSSSASRFPITRSVSTGAPFAILR